MISAFFMNFTLPLKNIVRILIIKEENSYLSVYTYHRYLIVRTEARRTPRRCTVPRRARKTERLQLIRGTERMR